MDNQKVGIYIRVSTQEQATDGYSIKEQEERLKMYATSQGWTIYKIYSDPGFSGAKLDRPALTELIQDVKSNKINKVVVYKLDRLSRRQRDTLYLIEDVFIPNNVDFISMTESFDTGTPLGRAMIGILSVFAQLERENIKERMQIGLDARAKEGYYHGGGYDPIGYDYIDGELVINEYEALQVKKIYELYIAGKSVSAIAKYLLDHHYTKRYGEWTDSAVRSVLTTPIYKGVIVWKDNEYVGRHTPIISDETFSKARQVNEQKFIDNPNLSRSAFERKTLLGGLLWCGNCGARYFSRRGGRSGHTGKGEKQYYYMCYSRNKSSKKMIKDPTCKNPNYNTKILDNVVLDEIKKLALDPSHLEDMLSKNIPTDNNKVKAVINKRIEEINAQINRLIDLYQIKGVDFNNINEKINTLTEERTSLEEELETLPEIVTSMSEREAREIFTSIPDILERCDDNEIKAVVHSLIESIIVYDNDLIEIHWKFE